MTFKPGDIIIHEEYNDCVLLVLEVDSRKTQYIAFILNHFTPEWIGRITNFGMANNCKLLQDMDLKNDL